MDLKIDDKNIHCLLRNCTDAFERPELEDYEYIVVNRNSGERKDLKFPPAIAGERRIAYGLRRESDGSVLPYMIRNINDGWEVTMMTPTIYDSIAHLSQHTEE